MITKKIGLVLLIAMLLNLLLFEGVQPAIADPFGVELQINTTTVGSQANPDVAMGSTGNFVVCWQDDSGGDTDIKAQRYGYPYTAQGGEISVATGTNPQEAATIAMDSSGNFVVCWEEFWGPDYDIGFRMFNSSGTATTAQLAVAGTVGVNERAPAVAMSPSGSFVACWARWNGVDFDVKAQRFDSTGTAVGAQIPVGSGAGNQYSPAVAINSSGNFVVAYSNASGGTYDIRAQRYDADGNAQGSAIDVATGAGMQNLPAIAMAPSGNFVISYSDDAAGDDDVKARRYDSSGTAQGDVIDVSSISGVTEDYSDIAMDLNGSFSIAYEDNSVGALDVYVQRYNSNGDYLDWTQANTYATSDQRFATIAMDDSGGSVGVWQSNGQDGSGNGVYGQRFSNISTTWYFAEGYTGTGFETWLTLQNPNSVAATANITYMFRGGGTSVKTKTIPANSRETVDVNGDVGSNKEVSIKVECDQPIVAERPMYFNYQNKWSGGHNTVGVTDTSTLWFFAEGYTGSGFEEWLTLQNPNAAAATVTVTYMYRGGTTQLVKTSTLNGNSRETINVNDDAGSNKEVSIMVASTQPIVAERPMYFKYQNKWSGGHNTIGATWPSATWYFAEGYTGTGFENWLTLQNPNVAAATATITYMFRGGGTSVKTKTIPAGSRETVDVNADAGSNKEVSIKVEATQQIVAERPIYFNYDNKWQGGDDTIGVTTPVNQWFLAEGYTGSGFEEWLTLQNPNSSAATATITYTFRGGGAAVVKTKTIAANSRETVSVNSDVGSNKEVSMRVDCTQPIIVERPMYFNYQSKWQGGHDTIGYGP